MNSAPKQILAIDDKKDILDIIRMALEGEGYQVYATSSANDGLSYYEKHSAEIGLVLLDYLMPEMTGDLVFESLQRINPDVRVLLLTACEDQVAKKMFTQGLRGYMQKPFYLDDLIQRVREEFDTL